MKRTFIYPVFAIIAMALFFSSCKSSRVWETKKKEKREYEERPVTYNRPAPAPPPRYYNLVPLIISPTPGFVMKQDRDGRYFHRTPQGYLYWKGNDNRFYLDNYHLSKVSYQQWEYEEWKRYKRASR